MARALMIFLVAVAMLAAAVPRAGAWEQRLSWDWGQHRTSLAGDEAPRPIVEPPVPQEHWDDPFAPVRFAAAW